MNVATGSFSSVRHAEEAYNALKREGFPDNSIGVVTQDRTKGELLARGLNRRFRPGERPGQAIPTDIYETLPDEYAETVRSSNLTDDAVNWYGQQLDHGNVLLLVEVGDRMDDADRVIREHEGLLYVDRGETRRQGMPEGETRVGAREGQYREIRLPIIEEAVTVEKSSHKVGEVEVSSETTTREVEVPVTVVHNTMRVERRRLEKEVTPDEYHTRATDQGIVRMPIVEEEVRVYKQPIIREELVITRIPVSEQKMIHETVSHTEPHIESTGDVNVEQRLPEEERKRRPAA